LALTAQLASEIIYFKALPVLPFGQNLQKCLFLTHISSHIANVSLLADLQNFRCASILLLETP
jgi:hypothetical protein